ncbi:MAG: alpha/beta hydrolase [Bacteroidales bacterium]|jgi:pimeloyl-ACP methyl ester carboxylesterase|nr:alpha/beta hydrolase [Bacteroidales bacterium]MCU0473703.1 alpha/beta hydrolase [Bacteroidales bacterium]
MEDFFRYGTGMIHYSDQGRGKVVVLLHGYLETSEIWSSFAGKLATNFRVITIDLPGHGSSGMFAEVHTMELIADAVYGLIKSIGISEIFLTGHSLGGYVALAFAELYNEMLSGYCLFHSHPLPDSAEALNKREREIRLVEAGKKDLMYPDNVSRMYATTNLQKFSEALKRSKGIASSIPGEGIIAVLRGMIKRPSRISVMESGIVPCLWILGAMDNYIDCLQIQMKVQLPDNATVVVLNNSGHLGFIEEEDKSVEVITKFIEKSDDFRGRQKS